MNEPLTPPKANQSTMIERIPASQLEKINRHILNRDPPTFRGVFDRFNLAGAGISFSAFWRYARRIRQQAEAVDLAELATPEDENIPCLLPRLLAQALLSALTQDGASPRAIRDLIASYKIATNMQFVLQDRAEELYKREEENRRRAEQQAQREEKAQRRETHRVGAELADIALRLKQLEPQRDEAGEPPPEMQEGPP